jgi:hypothetical protein
MLWRGRQEVAGSYPERDGATIGEHPEPAPKALEATQAMTSGAGSGDQPQS